MMARRQRHLAPLIHLRGAQGRLLLGLLRLAPVFALLIAERLRCLGPEPQLPSPLPRPLPSALLERRSLAHSPQQHPPLVDAVGARRELARDEAVQLAAGLLGRVAHDEVTRTRTRTRTLTHTRTPLAP